MSPSPVAAESGAVQVQARSVCERLLGTDQPRHNEIDWDEMRGWAEFPTATLLTPVQIDKVYAILKKRPSGEYGMDLDLKEWPYADGLSATFGKQIGRALSAYLGELAAFVAENSRGYLSKRCYLRTEAMDYLFSSGHNHPSYGITFTHALRGKPTWVDLSDGRRYEADPRNTIAFTNQFHGSPADAGERVVIICSFSRTYR